jgi:hypothetical protein
MYHWVQGLRLVFPAGTRWVGSLPLEHLLIKQSQFSEFLFLRNPTCWTVPQIIVTFITTHRHWKHILLVQYFLKNSLGSEMLFLHYMLVKQCVDCEPPMVVTVLLFGCVCSMNYLKVPKGDQCNKELGAVCNKTLLCMLSLKYFG